MGYLGKIIGESGSSARVLMGMERRGKRRLSAEIWQVARRIANRGGRWRQKKRLGGGLGGGVLEAAINVGDRGAPNGDTVEEGTMPLSFLGNVLVRKEVKGREDETDLGGLLEIGLLGGSKERPAFKAGGRE
ncbi:hypothetical protein AMTR_s00036p00126110 [Amborella trichopoda]|uniref:Uncharacterized protein n=1 Tax=Amborella trichopoda TaxID=13333 RepID=U5CYT6_AMBTC|nr:hypothetical protein AMTR_s00036p00126110 [Amborella trichopoda]